MNADSRERTLRIVYGALVASELTAKELSDSGNELVRGGALAQQLGELLVRLGADLAPARAKAPQKREKPVKARAAASPSQPKPRKAPDPKPDPGPDPYMALIDSRAARRQ